LRPGKYFGEISLIYDCLCTARVVANKYCTLAKLTKEKFKALITLIPQFREAINKGIYDYNDKMLKFIKKSMKTVPYLSNLEDECNYDIIFSLQTKRKFKGDSLQHAGDDADELYFLQSGIIEVYTEFESKEFVIERLFRGSIINYRTFFMEENGIVNLRFAAPSVLKALHKDRMEEICKKYPKMGKTFNQYKLKIIKEQKAVPLDYVMALPSKITKKIRKNAKKRMLGSAKFTEVIEDKRKEYRKNNHGQHMTNEEEQNFMKTFIPDAHVTQRMQRAFYLENMLKNVTIRHIVKIRELR